MPAIQDILARIRRFHADHRGVAAVEFAIIAPLLIGMYLVTMEVSQAIETNKKVSRVGSMVADLITQQQTMTKAELEAIMQIGSAIVQPYNRSNANITVTAIEIAGTPAVAKVLWSRKMVNGAFSVDRAKGVTVTVPTALRVSGTFLVEVRSSLAYKPVITYTAEQRSSLGAAAAFDGIAMGERYYLRPRVSSTIPCSNC